jgi:hypothetical protein
MTVSPIRILRQDRSPDGKGWSFGLLLWERHRKTLHKSWTGYVILLLAEFPGNGFLNPKLERERPLALFGRSLDRFPIRNRTGIRTFPLEKGKICSFPSDRK